MNNTGTLVQIIGAVVDADFSRSETLPALLNALEVDYEINGCWKSSSTSATAGCAPWP